MGGQSHAPAALQPGKTRYLLYRRLGGPLSRSGQVRKISPLPGIDPRMAQPAASHYTDYAIPAPYHIVVYHGVSLLAPHCDYIVDHLISTILQHIWYLLIGTILLKYVNLKETLDLVRM